MPSSSVVLEPIYFGATFAKNDPRDLIYKTQIEILQIYWKQFSKTLYQLNLLYLKYGVAATQCGLLLCRHGWPIDWSLLCRKYGRAAWGNPDDKLKIHQALKFGRPIIYVMLSNLSDCLLKLIMKVFWALILIVSMRFVVALSLLQY